LGPIDGHDPRKNVGVQLRVFYPAIVLGKGFGWQGLCFAFAAFIPPDVPTLRVLPFIDPDFFHNNQSIVILEVQIKREKEPKKVQSGEVLET